MKKLILKVMDLWILCLSIVAGALVIAVQFKFGWGWVFLCLGW